MANVREAFIRAEREFAHEAADPTLDDLRSDLARAIGDFANQNFAHRYASRSLLIPDSGLRYIDAK